MLTFQVNDAFTVYFERTEICSDLLIHIDTVTCQAVGSWKEHTSSPVLFVKLSSLN